MINKVKEYAKAQGISMALEMMKDNPEENLPKLLDWVDRFDKKNEMPKQRAMLRKILSDPENNWYKFLISLWSDIDDNVRGKFFENFIAYASAIGISRQNEMRKKYDCNFPWAILMDPTSACNLSCTGCWAAEYGDTMSMDIATLDDIINQGKEMGTYMYIYSGGEPLVRKDDIIKLCEKHSECMFLAFTNGTLIDEKFADEMLRVKNFIPAISIEGYEDETDFRRGKGTYKAVVDAMKLLKSKKLVFGASVCYTGKNTEVVGSDEYVDYLIGLGAKFAWYFTYMPIGTSAPTDLLATDTQREYMYYQIRKFRKTKPMFILDFWNDGEYVDGCIAGGRIYLHINANGDIEPCAFIHYSDSNIKEKTLLEAYKSPLFMEYRKNQPFSDNMLRPCPLLDNRDKLADMVSASGAHSTDLAEPEDAYDLCAKCHGAAAKWQVKADELWGKYKDNPL